MANFRGFVWALCVLIAGGVVGLLVDLDHVLFLVVHKIPITWDNLARQSSRFLHAPLVDLSLALFIVLGTLYVGLLFMGRPDEQTTGAAVTIQDARCK